MDKLAKKLTGGTLSLGGLLALIISIYANFYSANQPAIDFGMKVIWVVINTICSWLFVIWYFLFR